jgi:uncharacterized membrane protein required for colicin V production
MVAASTSAQWLPGENVGVISVLFCSFLFLFVFFCFVFRFAIAQAVLASRLDGITHAAGILTEALEKEKPTVGKNSDFSGNFAEGPKVSRRAG